MENNKCSIPNAQWVGRLGDWIVKGDVRSLLPH